MFLTAHDSLFVVRPGAWWTPTCWFGHPQIDLYVNIDAPVVRRGDRLFTIDLDLDVIRFTGGKVEIVDVDEFEEHQHRYGYPAHLAG